MIIKLLQAMVQVILTMIDKRNDYEKILRFRGLSQLRHG